MASGAKRVSASLSPGNFILPQTFSFYSPPFSCTPSSSPPGVHFFSRQQLDAVNTAKEETRGGEKQKSAFSFLNAPDAPVAAVAAAAGRGLYSLSLCSRLLQPSSTVSLSRS